MLLGWYFSGILSISSRSVVFARSCASRQQSLEGSRGHLSQLPSRGGGQKADAKLSCGSEPWELIGRQAVTGELGGAGPGMNKLVELSKTAY